MKHLTMVFICFVCSFSFSQDELKNEATTFINSNPIFSNLSKEKFFLHTNKTTYFSGEPINYKAYVVSDNTNLPSPITTNLHLSMYNFKKELIKHQLVFVENGTVNGSIELEKELNSGIYYLVLDTNYHAGFNQKNISEIQIINLSDNKSSIADNNEYDDSLVEQKTGIQVAFFPESDVLLSEANNTLFYKISLNGLPLETKGELINSFNNVVLGKLVSNKDGLGSVNFVCYPEQEYYFKITHDNKVYEIAVPQAQKEGFVIHYESNNSSLKEVRFSIRVNNDTAIKYDNETILAVIHRNNTCKSVIPFKVSKDTNSYLLGVNEESLFNGVNMISLFTNKNETISTRRFFHDKNKNIELSIDKSKETKDSLTLDLKMLNRYIEANTSVSILPEQSIVNNSFNTIYNAFLISPYVSKINNFKNIDLALQFVNPKNNILDASKEVVIREVENGMSISGEIITHLNNLNGYKVLFTSKENGYALIENIVDKNKFSFNNLLLYHPSKYDLALLNPIGKVVVANFKIDDQKLKYPVDSILDIKQNIKLKNKSHAAKSVAVEDQFHVIFEGEQLNEVLLFGKERKKEVVEDEFPDVGYINNPGELGNGFTRQKTKSDIECIGCTLFDYLDQFYELKTVVDSDGDSQVIFRTRGVNTIHGPIDALLIIDGVISHPSILTDIRAEDVKVVKLNRSGAGYGIQGSNGVIMVELKKPEDYLNSERSSPDKTKIFSSKTTFGFTKSIDLSKEQSLIFNSQTALEKYGTIDWIPNFILRPNTSNYINIAKENFTGLKLIINGFNNQGDLVSQEINIPLN
ncbi:hypothetical protein DI383_11965 [Flavobacteriaceae bacterium LYZ1037]|nr:hypothetical protein DI383_11965 [Flavobacteriaceae bacterium LYZ1037]